ncbi:uncharacterized protein TERG_12588 [Trichophyton rubrum CBS 118892]|uniref:Uncharacterized protein n=1 Tax=Trichophyton rubrum (strain ATCC MYA-4607 / CBS 118892) TaxID=559305 RepID=A0A080WXS6_TRIRC|nr:uncharacterized protein TERG_12588 [Trichophyton rubrum CBS 118892]KFL62813.1 hypothetical protein TERG_12588 [Trichophyton rubrum CBS 118892]
MSCTFLAYLYLYPCLFPFSFFFDIMLSPTSCFPHIVINTLPNLSLSLVSSSTRDFQTSSLSRMISTILLSIFFAAEVLALMIASSLFCVIWWCAISASIRVMSFSSLSLAACSALSSAVRTLSRFLEAAKRAWSSLLGP